MRRRAFITLLGGAAAWPLAAHAQSPPMPVIGYLAAQSNAHLIAALRRGLNEAGFIEGQNVVIEYRTADNDYSKLPALAAELVGRRVAVIVSSGGAPTGRAATAATKTIPIVFAVGGDPVKLGLVASMSRPGGNATGVSLMTTTLEAKRLELLREVVPGAGVIAFLVNPSNPDAETQLLEVQAAARSIEQQIVIVRASTESEFGPALASAAGQKARAILVANDSFFNGWRQNLVKMVAHHRVPAIYAYREFVAAGGLMSYSASLPDSYRQAGRYVGRILKGEQPGDLPVLQPTKFGLVINLKTAKTIGLTIPESFLLRADEVIE